MATVLTHETRKAWTFNVEVRDETGQPINLTHFDIKAQLRRVLDNRLCASLSLEDGLNYVHPDILFHFTAEKLSLAPGEYLLGFEYTSPSGVTSDIVLTEVFLTNRFIKSS